MKHSVHVTCVCVEYIYFSLYQNSYYMLPSCVSISLIKTRE